MKTFVEFRSTKFPAYDGEEEEINSGLCGHQYGEPDELWFTAPDKPIVRKLFKRIDPTEQLSRLTQAVNARLSADPDIRAVVWREP